MIKISNKNFWEKEDIITTQNKIKSASIYEKYLFEGAVNRLGSLQDIDSINIYGCGTGRDIKIIDEYFKPKEIVASDISENMIKICHENIKEWQIKARLKVVNANATELELQKESYDLVTLLNSMLTYVSKREDRLKIYKNSFDALKTNGVIIGTVHNQIGRPVKTLYFKLRSLFSFILKDRVGNKDTGFNGYKIPGYYYNKKWLIKDLEQEGFKNVDVYSLEDFFEKKGKVYDRKKGYNQLIFIATK